MKTVFFGCMTFVLKIMLLNYSYAQFQNPPGIEWKKIDTPHFEIIFPKEIHSDAQRIANTLEHVYEPVSKTLQVQPEKISLLLSNQTTMANGYVTLAPRYSEWFTTPPQFSLLGTNEWLNLLASHETRHIVQFEKLNSGFTKVMYYLFGENAWNFLGSWSVPGWVWEGDAVGTETALSNSGRGRMPEFDMEIRTLLLSGIRYSYYKAYLQSFKDWYPNMYNLGYVLTTHVKRKYGSEKFSEILRRSANWSFCPCSYSAISNSEIDKTSVEVYEETMDELDSLWKKQQEGLPITDGHLINRIKKSSYTNYLFPQYLADGSIVAQKWGMENIFAFVCIDQNGNEEDLCPTAQFGDPMTARGDKIIWNEPTYDLRWSKRDFTAIKMFDIKTHDKKTIASETKLFSPALSPDLKKIIAVEFTSDRTCSLVILDAESGKEISKFPNPSNDFFQTPSWTMDGKQIVAVKINERFGKSVALIDAITGQSQEAIPYSSENISLPIVHGKYLYYGSPYSGIDNIYALDLDTKQRYQVTSRKFGAFYPSVSPDGKKLAFSDYTVDGFDVVEMSIDPSTWTKIEKVQIRSVKYYEPLIAQESGGTVFENIPTKIYEVKDYSTLGHLLNFHSWSIFPGESGKDISLELFSTNIMNTMGLGFGYDYNWNEKKGAFSADVTYAGLYPILDAGVRYGLRTSTYSTSNSEQIHPYTWTEKSARLGFQLPFNLTKGIYSTSLTVGASISTVNISDKTYFEPDEINEGQFTPVSYRLQFRRGYQWIRDIYPASGQFFDLSYTHTPFKSSRYEGGLLSAQTFLFFRGLFNSHSLWFNVGYEKQNAKNYYFASEMRFPRGYDSHFHEKFFKVSANYALPIWYPDFHIWSLLNFKRLKVNVFFDQAEGRNKNSITRYQSAGYELTVDFNFLSFPFTLDYGVRSSYLFTEKKWVSEAVMGVGF